jgi:hypothetical protein
MKRKQIEEMILDLINEIDYDIAKDYDVETAEEPEYVKENMDKLVKIVKKYVKN